MSGINSGSAVSGSVRGNGLKNESHSRCLFRLRKILIFPVTFVQKIGSAGRKFIYIFFTALLVDFLCILPKPSHEQSKGKKFPMSQCK